MFPGMTESEAPPARFQRGTHLRVFRTGYFHHGVYDSDDRVFEFGGTIWDKPNARIRVVTLDEFAKLGRVTEVKHPGWATVAALPPAVDADEIIMRAEFLMVATPPDRYNVLGFNCETAANWCVCGGYSESHQSRTFFMVNALVKTWTFFYWGRHHSVPRWFVAYGIASPAAVFVYNWHIRAFWRDIGSQWKEYEQNQLGPP
jgi:hypothetical protein